MALASAGQILRQPVAREQPHVGAVLVREQPDAVELALEDQSAPVKRSCVSVAAIGSSQSGMFEGWASMEDRDCTMLPPV